MSRTPEVVWSRSRRRLWNRCPRRFRWQYYGDDETLEARRSLLAERQWLTRIVCDEIERVLRHAGPGAREVDRRNLTADADRRVTREWQARANGGLLAVAINFPADDDNQAIPGRVRKQVRAWLGRFAEAKTTTELLATPAARRRPPARDRRVDVSGVPVAAPPLWSRTTGDGRVVLCVWSVTDRPPADAAEWAAAGLLLCSRHGIALERLSVTADHLVADGEQQTFVFDPALLIEEQNRILEDAARWRAALAGGERCFPATPHVASCRECPFLQLCAEGREATGLAASIAAQ